MDGDGVYADAEWHGGPGSVAVVLIERGAVTETYGVAASFSSSYDAECAAVRLALALYPAHKVFTDCQSAARDCGVEWVPRTKNRAADSAARKAYRAHYVTAKTPRAVRERMSQPAAKKMKKKFRFRGRGVVLLHQKRTVFR